MNVVIDINGRISTVKVARSLGKGLDEEVIRAVKTWRFTPGMRDGHPVAVAMYMEIDLH
ncbi:MAG TPA: energy transducer TonB [Candidatus Angelobacter sp.]